MSFAFLTKSVTLGNLFSGSVLSVFYLVFNTKSLVSILFTFATNLSYTVFLTTSFFTTSLSLLKSTGTGTNCQCLIYQLQFLHKVNLFLVQNLKYQRMSHFLD